MKNIISKNLPDEIYVMIEIPMNSDPIKYEVDKETGFLHVDRFLPVAMRYPCNYGFMPSSLGGDGDPIDVLVITQYPIISGAIIEARPIGALVTEDENGIDEKIIAFPKVKSEPLFAHIKDIDDLHDLMKKQIKHFFEHYKDLETNKWVKVKDWIGAKEAKELIVKYTSASNE